MTTIHTLTLALQAAPAPLAAHVDEHAECRCGQDLETCTSGHCPRCGISRQLAA